MTRAAGGRGKHGSWWHEHTGSRHEWWCVYCACLVDVVHFFVWCRENSRITVALCVCADAQLWGSERWSSNVLGRRMRFERMTWTRKWMSRLWSFTVFSRRLRWQIPSFLGNHMACLWCCACMWSLHLQVETAVDITRNAMGTHRRTQYRPSLQIPWDLVIIALADCVSFTHVGL